MKNPQEGGIQAGIWYGVSRVGCAGLSAAGAGACCVGTAVVGCALCAGGFENGCYRICQFNSGKHANEPGNGSHDWVSKKGSEQYHP